LVRRPSIPNPGLFVMTLTYSDAIFIQLFPKECTEAFQEGHIERLAVVPGHPASGARGQLFGVSL